MLVEFLIDKDDYKKIIKDIDFTASNGIEIKKRSLKSSGKDNYYLRLTCSENELDAAIALSECRGKLENKFGENDFYYRILIDESSQYFNKFLYPLVMEFEVKLRKFIHNTLFDISEESINKVLCQLEKHLKKIEKGKKQIPKEDFLEQSTLEDIQKFLFSNNGLYGDVNSYTANREYACATRKALLDYISNNTHRTIWEDFFENNFSNCILPQNFSKIIACRNDVMHFHYISLERYMECEKLMKEVNADLDKQIKKCIVVENNIDNINRLSSDLWYQNNLLTNIKIWTGEDLLNKINNFNSLYDKITKFTNIVDPLQTYNESLSKAVTSIPTLPDLQNIILNATRYTDT